jgi:hypothetical protein
MSDRAFLLAGVSSLAMTIVGLAMLVVSLTPYKVTPEDIDTLKDAAALFGPGDPIARDLWRLAERLGGER